MSQRQRCSWRRRKWAFRLGCLAVLVAIILGLLGHFSETTVTIAGRTYQIDMCGVPRVVNK